MWYKDGQPLERRPELTQRTWGDYNSHLAIAHVMPRHAGNYTCEASNHAASDRQTAVIYVNVPPRWVVEPVDQNMQRGGDAIIHCKAEGFPPPIVVWRKEKPGPMAGVYLDPLQGSGVQQLPNGTLVLQNVTKETEGRYLCEVTNGVGAGRSRMITLTVNAPPRLVQHVGSSSVSVGVGGQAVLRCHFDGDQPMTLEWLKDGRRITHSQRYRHEVRESIVGVDLERKQQRVLELVVTAVKREDGGPYMCTAQNQHGHASSTVMLLVQEPPDLPHSLHIIEKSSRVVKLGWDAPLDGNSPISKYTLKYTRLGDWQEQEYYQQPKQTEHLNTQNHEVAAGGKREGGGGGGGGRMGTTKEVAVNGDKTEAVVEGLTPATQYMFTLHAHNAIGSSKPSEPLQVTTETEAPGGPPTQVDVQAISSTSLRVTWAPPDPALRHGRVLAYYITFGTVGSPNNTHKIITVETESWFTQQSSSSSSSSSIPLHGCCSTLISDLEPYTQYTVRIQAVNSQGPGPPSTHVTAATLEDVPSLPPAGVRCTPMTAHSVLVSWEGLSPTHSRGRLTGYRVIYSPADRGSEVSREGSSATSLPLRGLQAYTNYSIQVSATTQVGEGPASEPHYCTTEEDVPGPPAGVKAAMVRPGMIIVSWLPPVKSNGRLLTYLITLRGQDVKRSVVRAPASRHEMLLPVEASDKVMVIVAASTRVGEGQPSPPFTLIPSNTVPAQVVSWGGSTLVHWEEDVSLRCEVVGDPPPTRHWFRDGTPIGDGTHERVSSYPDGTLVLRDVQRSDSGNYTCVVTNPHGEDHISYILTVQVPPSPPHVHITRTGPTTLTVTWRMGDSGGAPLLGFTVSYKRDYGEWQEETVPPTQTSHDIKDLVCGSPYDLYVTAYNKVGDGRPSESLHTRTSGSPPLAGQREGAVQANTTWASVSLAHWGDGGCPLSHYSVRYRKTTVTTWIVVSERVEGVQSLELSGLSPSTQYLARVSAHNAAGTTTQDYTFTTSSIPGGSSSRGVAMAGVGVMDVRVMLPVLASSLALLATLITVCVCIRKKPQLPPLHQEEGVGSGEEGDLTAVQNKENLQHREQFYATVRKLSPHRDTHTPEYAEDIYPYATFQMNNSTQQQRQQQQSQQHYQQKPPPSQSQHYQQQQKASHQHQYHHQIPHALPQQQQLKQQILQHQGKPVPGQRQQHQSQLNNYPPCSYKEAMAGKEQMPSIEVAAAASLDTHYRMPGGRIGSDGDKVGVGGVLPGVVVMRGRHPTPAPHSIKSESEEYDSFGSDSDTDLPASSRTESSNQLDHERSDLMRAVHHNLIYHAAESSTSTEASPTLPRRSFCRKRDRLEIRSNTNGGSSSTLGGGGATYHHSPSSILSLSSPSPLPPPPPPHAIIPPIHSAPVTDPSEQSLKECDRELFRGKNNSMIAIEPGTTINV